MFESILKQATFFEAARAVVKIGSSLNNTKFNQVKLVQMCDTHCRIDIDYKF